MSSGNGDGVKAEGGRIVLNEEQMRRMEIMVENAALSRNELIRRLMDPRRSIEDECGYPGGKNSGPLTPQNYQQMFDWEPIARRVVQVLPRECAQVQPLVYEDEDPETATEFEQAWDELGSNLRPVKSWHKDEEGSVIWSYLRRLDEMSGIGSFGVLLIGIDDGLGLEQPVQGIDVQDSVGFMSTPSGGPVKEQGAQSWGTDAQYFDAITPRMSPAPGSGRGGTGSGGKARRRLIYLRVFPESLVQITRFESNPSNPRFGQPVQYKITLNDPAASNQSGIGLTASTVDVHWTRVLHVADNMDSASEVYGVPRMQPVWRRLMDLSKLYGGSAEMYWRGAFPGYSLETHPQLGGDVIIDKDAVRDTIEQYFNGLQRVAVWSGMSMKSLAPQVVDPTTQVNVQIEAICIQLGIPKRVFVGSERGELASSQDDAAWNDRLRERQRGHITPNILVPFIDRMIAMGILPEPGASSKLKEGNSNKALNPLRNRLHVVRNADGSTTIKKGGYSIEWPDLTSQSAQEKAQVALIRTQALTTFLQGNGEAGMTLADFYTKFMGMDEEEAQQVIENSEKAQEEKLKEHEALADEHGFQPTPPPGFKQPDPEPPPPEEKPVSPIKVKEGETLVHPETGKTIGGKP